MDPKNKDFNRNIKNYNRYRLYGKEAKVTLKLVKKLEQNFDQTSNQIEHFLNQLVKLCTCKSDNILLKNLGQDILTVNADFRKITNPFKYTFNGLISQLTQISQQFDGIEKIESKYKDAHHNRIKYERRPKSLSELFSRVLFSFKPQQNDFNNLALDFNFLDNTGKRIDRKLAALMKEEATLENTLITQCLNQELAIVIRIRKLVRMFAEQQIEYERGLMALFGRLDLVTERDVPEAILSLNNRELDQYFRPNRRSIFRSHQNAIPPAITKVDQTPDHNYYFRNAVAKQNRSYSLESIQEMNKISDGKSLEKQKNRTNLYYGSLCSLNDKVPPVNKTGNLVDKSNELNRESDKRDLIEPNNLISQQDLICHKDLICRFCDLNINNQSKLNPDNELTIAKNNLFSAINYHRCKLDHQNRQSKNQIDLYQMTNNDLKASTISPSASAPPIDEWSVEETKIDSKDHKSIEQRALNRIDNSTNRECINSNQIHFNNYNESRLDNGDETRWNNPNEIRLDNRNNYVDNRSNFVDNCNNLVDDRNNLVDNRNNLIDNHLNSDGTNNTHSWFNQTYCPECKNYQCKLEEAALEFVNNYRSFKAQVENCEKSYHNLKEANDKLSRDI